MSAHFDAHEGLIVVRTLVEGPGGSAVLRLALDTGATGTLINVGILVALGYEPGLEAKHIQVTTGSSVEFVPQIVVDRIFALEQERKDLPILSHSLPPSAGVDGLLGLDFFRGTRLLIDFQAGTITLN